MLAKNKISVVKSPLTFFQKQMEMLFWYTVIFPQMSLNLITLVSVPLEGWKLSICYPKILDQIPFFPKNPVPPVTATIITPKLYSNS